MLAGLKSSIHFLQCQRFLIVLCLNWFLLKESILRIASDFFQLFLVFICEENYQEPWAWALTTEVGLGREKKLEREREKER